MHNGTAPHPDVNSVSFLLYSRKAWNYIWETTWCLRSLSSSGRDLNVTDRNRGTGGMTESLGKLLNDHPGDRVPPSRRVSLWIVCAGSHPDSHVHQAGSNPLTDPFHCKTNKRTKRSTTTNVDGKTEHLLCSLLTYCATFSRTFSDEMANHWCVLIAEWECHDLLWPETTSSSKIPLAWHVIAGCGAHITPIVKHQEGQGKGPLAKGLFHKPQMNLFLVSMVRQALSLWLQSSFVCVFNIL